MVLKFNISQIDYMTKNGDQFTILSNDKRMISCLSVEILDSILSNKNTIVFSQGNLNMTPLLASAYSLKNDSDIVVFLPEREFEEQYKKYTKAFFSLLYKKKQNPFQSFFFYYDILWCKGQFNSLKELINLEIEKTPIHGDSQFKKRYKDLMMSNFKTKRIKITREIVFVPIGKSFPLRILGEKNIQYEGFRSKLEFNPKFYILESLNETFYNFEIVFALLKRFKQEGIGYLLHFSWPYLRGLKEFLDRFKSDTDPPKVIHLGKRLCFELKTKFKKPESFALGLSLEGDLWDRQYYPEKIIPNSKIIIPINNVYTFKTINELEDHESQIDYMLSEFNLLPKENYESEFINSIINFPPALDSVVLPSDIKDFDNSINKYIPLEDYIEKKIGKDTFAFVLFNGICKELQKTRNLAYNIRGLYTHSSIRKFTLLQMFLLNIIGEKMDKKNSLFMDKVIILDQFRGLSTSTGLNDHLEYLISSLNYVIGKIELPSIKPLKDSLELIIKNESFKVWQSGKFVLFDRKLLGSKCCGKYDNINLSINVSKVETSHIKIDFILNLPTQYTQFDYYSYQDNIDTYMWEGLPIFSINIFADGTYKSKSLKSISFEKLDIKYKWLYDHDKKCEYIDSRMKIKYLRSSKIRQLSSEDIRNSILIVAGPIPFTTFSYGEVYLTKEFDILFMPFKEIIFFVYPGRNFRFLKKQLNIFKDLVSNTPTLCSTKDLEFSILNSQSALINKLVSPKSLTIVPLNESKKGLDNGSKEINEIILNEILDESKSDSYDKYEIRKIKEIIHSVEKNYNRFTDEQIDLIGSPDLIDKEMIKFKAMFDDETIDVISFHRNKLLRKISNHDFILTPAYTLSIGDEVLFIQTSSRESIDEFILKILNEDESDLLKRIFEPLICLNLFYTALLSIPSFNKFSESSSFNKLYWLTISEKQFIFNLMKLLLNNNSSLPQIEQLMLDDENNIWYKIITSKELMNILSKNDFRINYETLYEITKFAGFSLVANTFETYCKGEINKHYYFRDKNNLLSIGKIIGNKNIIENYIQINESGEKIAVTLRMIGQSVSRVVSGNSDQLNEMDALIESSIKKCKILSIID